MSNESNKKEPKFDKYQTEAINARNNSVVSAGAGSGKTTVLAERFSSLVLDRNENTGVDQILTLTFTKKATVEMSARIYRVLRQHNPEKAADFYKANIKTLDSYCNTVAKMGCQYYGISPDFTQDDEQISSAVYSMALPFILENKDRESIKALVTAEGFDNLASELFVQPILSNSTIAEPIDFDRMIEKQIKFIVDNWNSKTEEINGIIAQMEKLFENAHESMNTSTANYAKYAIFFGNNVTEEIPEPLVISADDIREQKIEKIIAYTKSIKAVSELPKPGNAKGLKDLTPSLNELKEKCGQLFSLFNFIYGYKTTADLIPLLKEFQDRVNRYKRSTGILSFKDISNMAKCILRDYPEIRAIEKNRYKYIMIDEFQDNNQDQRDMLFMLAEKKSICKKGVPSVDELEEKKLFFVGDEKQSIYRFRGADVSVFNALSNDFSKGNLNMSTNYRSDSALIMGFNTIFGGCDYPIPPAPVENKEMEESLNAQKIPAAFFTENSNLNEVPNYEAVYKNVLLPELKQKEADSTENREKIFRPHIHFGLYNLDQEVAPGDYSTEEAEAQWIAEKIRKITTEGIDGTVYTFSDIAILTKTYSLQPLYEKVFLKNGIPYNAEVVTGFFSDGPVNDIFSMLRLCAYPEDTMAYSQVLRSPWVNLTFTQANEIILAKEKNTLPFSEDAEKILPSDALRRFNHAKEFFIDLNLTAKTEPLTKTVTKLWYDSGYRFETMWNNRVLMYGKLYDLIFELARQSEENKMTLGAFVDSVRSYRDQAERLDNMDIPMEQSEGVHILSIHKSKGLEYPIVFVAATHKKGVNDINNTAAYSSREHGITINTPCHPEIGGSNFFFELAKKENQNQNAAELRRLTYVALTRAKNHLFITNGKYTPGNNVQNYIPGQESNPTKIFQILEPVYNHYFEERDSAMESGPFSREFIISANLGKGDMDDNNEDAKINLLKSLEKAKTYAKAEEIEKEEPKKIYANPSQLHAADDETYTKVKLNNSVPYCEGTFKIYDRINEIIESTVQEYEGKEKVPSFDHTHFGTIAHAYLEAKINGTVPVYSNRTTVGLENRTSAIKEIEEICTLMADSFEKSELGKKAINSKWHKAEYDFRCRINMDDGSSKIIKGSIDLVFENDDGTYTVVDYKTNQTINPETYIAQLACYREAVSQMMGVGPEKVFCSLYYLRFNREIDITKETSSANLQDAIRAYENLNS